MTLEHRMKISPLPLSPLQTERTIRARGALEKRTSTNTDVIFMDQWLGFKGNKPFSGWYTRSDVLPKYIGTGNYDVNRKNVIWGSKCTSISSNSKYQDLIY